jgi:endonuclease III
MPTKLKRVVQSLRAQHGPVAVPPPANAFEQVLWEKVAYLATDDRRAAAFEALRSRVGLTPEAILAARPAVLREVAAMGGSVAIDDRVRHMQDAAALVADEFGGNLDRAGKFDLRDAIKALRRFHGIGEPGAERILLLTRAHKLLPLDSNGARVMVRLGYGREDKNYGAMYRSVRQAAAPELTQTFDWLTDAHLLLRRHGQEVCKTSKPRCSECLVRPECQFAMGRAKPLR